MTTPEPTHTPTVPELFAGFLGVGLMGFGGVLPLARRMIVEQRRWLAAPEFTDLLALCQFLPGGNIINLSVAIGLRFRGGVGAVVALVGLLAAPTAVAIALGAIYGRFSGDPTVRHLFAGLASAAAGLILAMAAKIAWPVRHDVAAVLVAGATFAAIALMRLPLLPVMLVMAPLSAAIAWRKGR